MCFCSLWFPVASIRLFERLGALLRRQHPDKTLLFSTDAGVSNGVALLASMRAGFEEATGLNYKGGNSPSSGLLAAILASQMCASVAMYGFSLGNCLGKCPPYHYWSRKNGKERNTGTSYKGHQYDVEGWLLKALHVMGLVCISPQPSKLPPCGSRLGGMLDKHGNLVGRQELVERQQELLLSNKFLQDIVLGKSLAVSEEANEGARGSNGNARKRAAATRGRVRISSRRRKHRQGSAIADI